MYILKREIIYCFILLCSAMHCSCSTKEYGTKEKPASVGQTMYYDGTEALKEKNALRRK